jgi:hypothetical protein
MLNVNIVGNKSKLTQVFTTLSTEIVVPTTDRPLFDVGVNNHSYVTLRSGSKVERIKISGLTTNGVAVVARGIDGTTPQEFMNACIEVEWCASMVCEFVKSCVAGTSAEPAPTVQAQTICMSSCACLDIDSSGRIIKITKSGC